MPGAQQDVGPERLDAGQGGAQVGDAHRVLLEIDDAEAVLLGPVPRPVRDFEGEEVVGGQDGDRLGPGHQGGGRPQHAGRVLVGGAQDAEDVAVALGKDLSGRAVGLDHRDPVLLGDGGVGERRRAAVGPEQEAHVVLADQPVGQLGRDLGLALIIVVDDLDPVGLRPDLEPAAGVHGLGPEVVALLGEGTLPGFRPRRRQRRADPEDVAGAGRGGGEPGRDPDRDGRREAPHPSHHRGIPPCREAPGLRRRRSVPRAGPRGGPALAPCATFVSWNDTKERPG